MTTVHKNLTGADLHEPKGADTALNGQIYVSNGSGSGVWTTASSVVINTAFTTGDLKTTHKTSADSTWILWVDGSIGDGSSSATIRANSDTAALFAVYWNGYSNVLCPVSGGRGASAVADFAAHKTITLPPGAGRNLGVAGSGAGLTARTLGSNVGLETVTMLRSDLPNVTVPVSISDPGHAHSVSHNANSANGSSTTGGGGFTIPATSGASISTVPVVTGITAFFALNSGVGQTTMNNMSPTAYVNVMVKL